MVVWKHLNYLTFCPASCPVIIFERSHPRHGGWRGVRVEIRRPADGLLLDHLAGGRRLRHGVADRRGGTGRHHVARWVWSVTSSSGRRRSVWSDLGGMKRGRPRGQ